MKSRGALGEEVFPELRSKLDQFSDRLSVREADGQLSIEPFGPNTFPIQVTDDGREMTISAVRWHTHEDTAEQTVACVMWLLTPFYRIVETERKGAFQFARLEKFEPPGKWVWSTEMGLIFRNFWGKRDLVRIAHQQSVIPPPPEFLKEFAPGALHAGGVPPGSVLGNHVLEA